MILGNEMQQIQSAIMREVVDEIQNESFGGGALDTAVCDALQLGVDKYVYSVYYPTVYGRRMQQHGLASIYNYITAFRPLPNGQHIEISDMTPAGDNGMANPPPDPVFYLSDIIEAGANGPKWHDPDWPGPRPYMEDSEQDGCNKNGVISDALEDLINNLNLSMI